MKTLVKAAGIVGLFTISGFAMASDPCPNSLSADEMYDCIVVEGAGGTYMKEKEQAKPEAVQAKKAPVEKHPNQRASTATQNSKI